MAECPAEMFEDDRGRLVERRADIDRAVGDLGYRLQQPETQLAFIQGAKPGFRDLFGLDPRAPLAVEPPLGEELEIYRVEALAADGEVLRDWDTPICEAVYPAAQRAADGAVRWRVRQVSAVFGWGAAAEAAF